VVWTSASGNTFGSGPYAIADGLIYLLNDSGVLTLVEATSAGYTQLGRVKVLDGIESWAPMAIASGRLMVRDLTRMVCLDIGQP
jgi:outer membrane protein assembly factor BamB